MIFVYKGILKVFRAQELAVLKDLLLTVARQMPIDVFTNGGCAWNVTILRTLDKPEPVPTG